MKERPIIFNAEVVKAILEGRKTQTRRVIKPQPAEGNTIEKINDDFYEYNPRKKYKIKMTQPLKCPFGEAPYLEQRLNGDQLWVRETWKFNKDYWLEAFNPNNAQIIYKDGTEVSLVLTQESAPGLNRWQIAKYSNSWCPSIHMPRWASRINLKITDIRVERIQDISYRDILAEGVVCECREESPPARIINKHCSACSFKGIMVAQWKALWDSINEKRGYSWEVNPWVWVIEFEVM